MGTKWKQSGNKNSKVEQEWKQSGNKEGTRTLKWKKPNSFQNLKKFGFGTTYLDF